MSEEEKEAIYKTAIEVGEIIGRYGTDKQIELFEKMLEDYKIKSSEYFRLQQENKEWFDIADNILRATNKYGEISIGEVAKYISKLQKENEELEKQREYYQNRVYILEEDIYTLVREGKDARFELQRRIDKLKKDLENLKEVERQICCEELITKDKYQDILKENADLKMQLEIEKIDNKYNKEEAGEEMIPRDKIRTRIKELEEQQAIEIEETGMSLLSVPIRILKELLEDN